MALFDSVINEVKEKFGIGGDKAGGLIAALLGLMADPKLGGFGGFIDRFKNAGLGDVVGSWISSGDNTPLTGDQVESALGSDTIDSIAADAGVDRETASGALGGIIPSVVDKLTPDGEIPDEESLLSKIGGFLSDWGGAVTGAVAGGVGAAAAVASGAADKVGDAVGSVGGKVSDTVNRVGDSIDSDTGGSILRWLLPLLLLGLVVLLGFWFCGRSAPVGPLNANANANRANTNTAAKTVDSSFRIEAKDGKYVVSGVVPDQKTLDEIKVKLDGQFGAGNVDFAGLKVDANAKPFAAGWWANFSQMLPNLKDWKTGTLAFAGNTITEAVGLPAAALDQLKSLFGGWKLPDTLGTGAAETAKTLAEVTLPNGTKLQAYPGGIEDQLVKFIQSDEYKNGTAETLKDKWFSFDDLNFVIGKTELTPESKRQLDNIIAILKAFPDLKIKIGGYTDKTGDDAANLKLSDSRAKAVQAALQKAGVGTQVPEAEGYGEKFATVEENASDEARKVDRKTAVRLIK
ncbi:MAG TPA: YidB family protein [Pyrinomonadaceae bacterium]|nr:YidB family protein [Pyrinomonadaceae bacterium]